MDAVIHRYLTATFFFEQLDTQKLQHKQQTDQMKNAQNTLKGSVSTAQMENSQCTSTTATTSESSATFIPMQSEPARKLVTQHMATSVLEKNANNLRNQSENPLDTKKFADLCSECRKAKKLAFLLQRTLDANPAIITTYCNLTLSAGLVINMLCFEVSFGLILAQQVMTLLPFDDRKDTLEWLKQVKNIGCAPQCNESNLESIFHTDY